MTEGELLKRCASNLAKDLESDERLYNFIKQFENSFLSNDVIDCIANHSSNKNLFMSRYEKCKNRIEIEQLEGKIKKLKEENSKLQNIDVPYVCISEKSLLRGDKIIEAYYEAESKLLKEDEK